jgi:hypothetical protein
MIICQKCGCRMYSGTPETWNTRSEADAEIAKLRAEREELVKALETIRAHDWIENALDPQWAASIATAALAKVKDLS